MDLPKEQKVAATSVEREFYQISGQSKEPTCIVATASFMQCIVYVFNKWSSVVQPQFASFCVHR